MWSGPEQYSENHSQKVPAKFEIFQKHCASIVLKWTVTTQHVLPAEVPRVRIWRDVYDDCSIKSVAVKKEIET